MERTEAVTLIGFDSAWANNPRAPGAICALRSESDGNWSLTDPVLVSFSDASRFIGDLRQANGICVVAIDQPTIVPNPTSLRPVDRVAASLISWLGGGVQPANRSKIGLFDDTAPIWRFKAELGATEDPELARTAADGLHLVEVFPALALPTIGPEFFGRLLGPRYNPERRKTYTRTSWDRVLDAAAAFARGLELACVTEWCESHRVVSTPRKADQDKLDAILCVLIAFTWRMQPRQASIMIGDLTSGYMVAPASMGVRSRLTDAAKRYGVPVDGAIPSERHGTVSARGCAPMAQAGA